MSDVKKAAWDYFAHHAGVHEHGEEIAVLAFLAGAAWQREQDARIAESAEKRHLVMEDPTSAAVCGQVAAMIREDAKQDSDDGKHWCIGFGCADCKGEAK